MDIIILILICDISSMYIVNAGGMISVVSVNQQVGRGEKINLSIYNAKEQQTIVCMYAHDDDYLIQTQERCDGTSEVLYIQQTRVDM